MSDEPKRRSWGWIGVAALGALPVLYVLSVGPAEALLRHGYIGQKIASTTYAPLRWVHDNSTVAGRFLEGYVSAWR
jgi:hypothetical protein